MKKLPLCFLIEYCESNDGHISVRKKTPSDSFFRPNGLLYRGGSVRKYRYVLQDLFAFQKAYRSVTFKGSQTVQIPKEPGKAQGRPFSPKLSMAHGF